MNFTPSCSGYNGGILIIVVAVCLQTYIAESRSLSPDEYFPSTIFKRNSWWSKKSLDNLSIPPNKQVDIPPPVQMDRVRMDSGCEDALSVYRCYANLCVPDFVECSRMSMSTEVYEMCKLEHSMCATRCFNGSGSESDLK